MSRKVLILRGIPGCGKSTYARKVSDYSPGILYKPCSTDHFFTSNDGHYLFEPARLGEAHAWCFRGYLTWLEGFPRAEEDGLVIVDNTNISSWEINPYVLAASAYGWEHEVVTLFCDPVVALKRQTHGVPAHVVLNMHARLLTETLPPFWKQSAVFLEGDQHAAEQTNQRAAKEPRSPRFRSFSHGSGNRRSHGL